MTRLPKLEIYFYYGSWLCGIIYSAYRVHLVGNERTYELATLESSLVDGWSFLERKKDETDDEWKLWVNFILYIVSPWILVHYIGAQIINRTHVKMLPLWYITVTALCVINNYGPCPFVILFIQPVIFSLLMIFSRRRILIWLICYTLYHIFTHETIITLYSVPYEDLQFIIPTLMWIYLRCISFCMDFKNDEINLLNVYSFFGYVFYLPCFFLGPILLYDKFSEQLYTRRKRCTIFSELLLILQNFRYLLWLLVTEFMLHFIYVNSLQSYIDTLSKMNYGSVWIMYGIGFFMGQFFFLKYTVVYGLALAWTKAEGYDSPDPPRCIAYICLYSDMWRYFDQALYFFIRRYIYDPCIEYSAKKSQLNKLAISFLCFVFIYVWHGLHYPVFMWSLLNYCGIVVETSARRLSGTQYYSRFKNRIGSPMEQRLIGFFCAPLTILSAISNFYFLGGATVAETYFSYIFMRGSISSTLCLWFFVYSLCQVSMEIKAARKVPE